MKKKVLLFFISTLLSQAAIYAQRIYVETGFNTLGNIDYTNLDDIDFKSERILLPQKSIEAGLRHQVSQRCIISMGLSSTAHNFTNNLYIPTDSTTNDRIHVKSLFELGYLGGNLGVDLVLVENDQWSLFTSGKLSGNLLDRGVRTDKVMNADPSILPNPNTNLMLDDNFQKLWFNIQYGLALSYQVSSSTALYTRYNFSQSLTSIKNDRESYDFSSHAFSVGLTFNIREHRSDSHQLTNDDGNTFYWTSTLTTSDGSTFDATWRKYYKYSSGASLSFLKTFYPAVASSPTTNGSYFNFRAIRAVIYE